MLRLVCLSILIGTSICLQIGNVYITPCDKTAPTSGSHQVSELSHDCKLKLVITEKLSHLGGEGATIALSEAYHTELEKFVVLTHKMTIKIKPNRSMISYRMSPRGSVHGLIVEKEFQDKKDTKGCSQYDKSVKGHKSLPCPKSTDSLEMGYCCPRCEERPSRCSTGPSVHCLEASELQYQLIRLSHPEFYQKVTISVTSSLSALNVKAFSLDSHNGKATKKRLSALLSSPAVLCTSETLQCLLPYRDHFLLLARDEKKKKTHSTSKDLARKSLLIRDDTVDLDDLLCGKIGSSAKSFRNQGDRCIQKPSSCLGPQPVDLFNKDQERLAQGLKPLNMTAAFGYPEDILIVNKTEYFTTIPATVSEDGAYLILEIALKNEDIQEKPSDKPFIVDMSISSSTPAQTVVHVHYQTVANDTRSYAAEVDSASCWPFYLAPQAVTTDKTRRMVRIGASLTAGKGRKGEKVSCKVTLSDKSSGIVDKQTLQFEVGNECWCQRKCKCVCQRSARNTGCLILGSLSGKSGRCRNHFWSALITLILILLLMGTCKAVIEHFRAGASPLKSDYGPVGAFMINVFYFFLQPFILLGVITLEKPQKAVELKKPSK